MRGAAPSPCTPLAGWICHWNNDSERPDKGGHRFGGDPDQPPVLTHPPSHRCGTSTNGAINIWPPTDGEACSKGDFGERRALHNAEEMLTRARDITVGPSLGT